VNDEKFVGSDLVHSKWPFDSNARWTEMYPIITLNKDFRFLGGAATKQGTGQAT